MRIVFTDIDGVLTDGRVIIGIGGNETKTICYRDLDAIGIGRRNGCDFAFVTGEDTEMVNAIAKRFKVEKVYAGAKDKLFTMAKIAEELGVSVESLLYIGDSDRDAPALEAVGLGIAPRDASANALNAADVVTESKGGYGVLLEVVNKLIAGKLKFPEERRI
jgi:YrbI family 3-deoxy-D-manno-octulosonate 8-phosphate phosphatase